MLALGYRYHCLLLVAFIICAPVLVQADDTAIMPLHEYAERNDITERMSIRFVLDRCTALYTFALSTVKSKQDPLSADYESKAASFLTAARVATPEKEVLLMLVLRMSNAYRRHATVRSEGDNPLAMPLLQADLAFCGAYLTTLNDMPFPKAVGP